MRVSFNGHDFDLFDNEARTLAVRQYAEQLVGNRLAEGYESGKEIAETLLAGMSDFWLQASSTLAMAHASGCEGLTLRQVQEMLAYVGEMVGQRPLIVCTPEEAAEAQLLKVPGAEP